jgi:lysophospholipase L1-like esterase
VKRSEALLLLGSVVLGLGAAELVVRSLGLLRPRASGYAPVDTARPVSKPRNSLGYRDLERSLAKPAGARRIVVLGDSFTWGAGVDFDDTYAQRLERALSRRRGLPVEAVNLALPGFATADELAVLERQGFAYQPDLVLLGFVLNDAEDEASAEKRREADWIRTRSEAPPLWQRSELLRFVGLRLWATRENRRRVADYLAMYQDGAAGWGTVQRSLETMGALCRGHGALLVVAIFPLFGNRLDEGYPFDRIHAKVAAAAQRAGARVVDLLPAYRGLRSELLVVDAEDEHPNEIAQRIAAKTLLPVVEEALR